MTRERVGQVVTAFAALGFLGGTEPTDPGSFVQRLVAAAIAQTSGHVVYDGSYRKIPYPGGDVPLIAHNIGNGPDVSSLVGGEPETEARESGERLDARHHHPITSAND